MPAADAPREGWWARLLDDEQPGRPAEQSLVAVLTAEFPAQSVVDLPGGRRPSGWAIALRQERGGGRIRAVEVAPSAAPLLWYVELPEADATTVVAFSDRRFADATFLDDDEARAARVAGDGQVAAVRWWHEEGLVHQIYVDPRHRRRGVALKLLHVAHAVQFARGLPRLHGDGRRTDLGEALVGGLPAYAAWRLSPRTHRLPPMTPEDRAEWDRAGLPPEPVPLTR